jgi:hypothetical protein
MKLTNSVAEWKAEPFSYSKVCSTISIWFGMASFLMIPDVPGYPHSWLAIWGVANYLFQRLMRRIVWRHLGRSFQDNIPYDSTEAEAGKGTIHSYPELLAWFVGGQSRVDRPGRD